MFIILYFLMALLGICILITILASILDENYYIVKEYKYYLKESFNRTGEKHNTSMKDLIEETSNNSYVKAALYILGIVMFTSAYPVMKTTEYIIKSGI